MSADKILTKYLRYTETEKGTGQRPDWEEPAQVNNVSTRVRYQYIYNITYRDVHNKSEPCNTTTNSYWLSDICQLSFKYALSDVAICYTIIKGQIT